MANVHQEPDMHDKLLEQRYRKPAKLTKESSARVKTYKDNSAKLSYTMSLGKVISYAIVATIFITLTARLVYDYNYSSAPFSEFIFKLFNANWTTIDFDIVGWTTSWTGQIEWEWLRNIVQIIFVPTSFMADAIKSLLNFIIGFFQVFFNL